MKKQTIIAVAVLACLVGALLLVLQHEPRGEQKIEYSVPSVEKVDKIQIDNGDKKVVVAKKGETWSLVEPVDYPVDEAVSGDLDKLLKQGIGIDMAKGKVDATQYELGPTAPKVTFFEGTNAVAALRLGKEAQIQATGVKRTFVMPDGQEEIFRAQAGLATTLVRDLDKWRAKKVTTFETSAVTAMEIAYDDAKLAFVRKDEKWELTSQAGVNLDQSAVDRLAAAAGRIRVDGFADEVNPEGAGVVSPMMTLTFTVTGQDEPVVVKLGGPVRAEDGTVADNPDQYLQIGDAKWIYTVKSWSHKNLFKKLGDLRDKEMLTMDADQIATLNFVGAGPENSNIVIAKTADGWELTEPKKEAVPTANVTKITGFLSKVRAKDIPDGVSAETAGIGGEGAKRLEIKRTDDSVTVLHIGKPVAEGQNDIYARVGEDGLIFTIASWSADNLNPTVEELVTEPPPPPAMPEGMPPGMGMPGMPGGMRGMPGGMPPGMR
jgi:hypothetical protein